MAYQNRRLVFSFYQRQYFKARCTHQNHHLHRRSLNTQLPTAIRTISFDMRSPTNAHQRRNCHSLSSGDQEYVFNDEVRNSVSIRLTTSFDDRFQALFGLMTTSAILEQARRLVQTSWKVRVKTRRRDYWTDNAFCYGASPESSAISRDDLAAYSYQVVTIVPEAEAKAESEIADKDIVVTQLAQAPVSPESDVGSVGGLLLPHTVPEWAAHEPAKFTSAQSWSQTKPPVQAEWEQLWYHGVSAAFEKIAHLFPSLQLSNSSLGRGLVEQNIAEPTLDVSSLKQEEQSIFEQDEKPLQQPFAPKSLQEREDRLRRAATATDERQRLALLLGLPTFEEYIEKIHNQQNKEQERISSGVVSKRQQRRQAKFASKRQAKAAKEAPVPCALDEGHLCDSQFPLQTSKTPHWGMTQDKGNQAETTIPAGGAEHRPLVVGLRKPSNTRSASTMASSSEAAAVSKEMAENVKSNTAEAGPAESSTAGPPQKPKKEKAPKQPKPPKAAAPAAPTSPALIDLRVGHILRAIAHPNADSLYVSTIAMGDAEGTEHTQVDEETGKVVRTVCSGLNGLVPLEEMQNRKVVVVANLKPVNMRSIKSAAMVLAASPKQPEGADPHAPDRVVELVSPPQNAEAGDKVYFEGWPYGDGKGPEKQLNPKKKQWEAIQPGFYTSDDLIVGFDASQCEEVDGASKGKLIVEGKGDCTVKTLKGAVVR